MRDLFENLRRKVGCDYISDLRFEPFNSLAKESMKDFVIDEFSLHALSEAAKYLYAEKHDFQSLEEAKCFFGK